ncbi:MAG: glycosyltransferase family 2 protein [Candidatus Omnitrophota bacterium]
MKVSIITVVYNNADYIEDCMKSVVSQSYPDVEYIMIDGKSTDGTLEIISRYRDKIAKVVSEEDVGYVYAMNKGAKMATGDIVGFLHSDDIYTHSKVIEKVAAAFINRSCDSLYGNLLYVKKNNPDRIIRHWKGGDYSANKIRRGWMPPHPTFFVKRAIYEKHGYFNTNFKIAADYELILRFLYKCRISTCYINEVLAKMRWGGKSNKNIRNIAQKSLEDYRALRMYGLGIRTLLMKNIIKLPQFFLR